MSETKEVVTPGVGKLNWRDVGKGLIVTVIGAVVALIGTSIDAGNFVFEWAPIWHTAVAAGVSYIIKNIFTPSVTVTPTEKS